jgi:hypothetical protein
MATDPTDPTATRKLNDVEANTRVRAARRVLGLHDLSTCAWFRHKRTRALYTVRSCAIDVTTLEVCVQYERTGGVAPVVILWSRPLDEFIEKFEYVTRP